MNPTPPPRPSARAAPGVARAPGGHGQLEAIASIRVALLRAWPVGRTAPRRTCGDAFATPQWLSSHTDPDAAPSISDTGCQS
jgi:hypothetical protein